MAKNETKSVAVRVKKPRTLAQQLKDKARKEENIRLYNERCARLKAQQAAENDPVLQAQIIADRIAADQREKAKQQRQQVAQFKARFGEQYVRIAQSGPHAKELSRWLAGREPEFERVFRFFQERPKLQAPQIDVINQKIA